MANDEDDSQKTEEPTAKKLEDSRKKGEVPLSKEMNNWVMLLVGTIVLLSFGGTMMASMADSFKTLLMNSFQLHGASGGIGKVLYELFMDVASAMFVPIIIFIIAAIGAGIVQVGPMIAPESIKPKLSKISPIAGFKRLFSMRSIFEFVKGILKISIVATISVILLYPFFQSIDHFVGLPLPQILDEFWALLFRMMAGVLVVLFVLAVLDVLYQRMEHMKKMRMSRKEVKDEHRQTEGDPHIKAKLRQLRMQKAQQRMIQSVPDATVVITNPTHYAIALKYDGDTMDAPLCVAKGVDKVAARIREVAKENDVELVENKPLARALYDTVEIDETIPMEHYQAVAEIISYVYRLKGKLK
jgi:flagellar biosynthetic protein FlhB